MPTFTPHLVPPSGTAPDGRWYLVRRSEILLDDAGTVPNLAAAPEHGRVAVSEGPGAGEGDGERDETAPIFLGMLDDMACWAAGADAGTVAPPGHHWAPLIQLGAQWPIDEWLLAGRAVQLVEWRRTNRYCGRCATPTVLAEGERARRCPACGLVAYPRLAPAVIVLVRRGDQALLAAGRSFRGGMYSALAGFVEPGENLEEAVAREVGEEVGVTVGDVRYAGSQPWPFPHSLMVAFEARWTSGEITVDGDEILDAGWYRADDLPPVPPSMSVARSLIDAWVADVER